MYIAFYTVFSTAFSFNAPEHDQKRQKPWFWITDRPLSQPFWYKNYRFFFRQNASRPRKLTHTLLHTTMAVLGKHSGYISSSSSVKIPKRLAGKDLLLRLDVLFG